MASTFSTNLRLELQTTGENDATWGQKANNVFEMIEDAISGYVSIAIADADMELEPSVDGLYADHRNMTLSFTGTLTADRTVTIPAVAKIYLMRNFTTGGFSVVIKIKDSSPAVTLTLARGSLISRPNGQWKYVYTNGVGLYSSDEWATLSSPAQRWSIPAAIDSLGAMQVGKFIDFHNTNTNTTAYSVRLGTVNQGGAVSTTDLFIGAEASISRKIWHEGNDGHTTDGTGLDADLVDGLHASQLGFAIGTSMLFLQSTAPVGWTKLTTHDNKALRIVSGTPGSGGTVAFTTAFASGNVGDTTLTIAQMPSHTHGGVTGTDSPDHSHFLNIQSGTVSAFHTHNFTDRGRAGNIVTGNVSAGISASGQEGVFTTATENQNHTHNVQGNTVGASARHTHTITSEGSGAVHTHSINLAVAYVDAIICIRG